MSKSQTKLHQEAFLAKAKARTEPLFFTIEDVELKVNPGVFLPATDTKLLASHINPKSGDRILDLTTGAGFSAVIAGLRGASGYAIDINKAAIQNALENITKYKVDVKPLISNLFEKVPPEKFDQIYVNGPFFEGKIIDPLDYACYGAKFFYNALFKQLSLFLKPTGKALIVFSQSGDVFFLENEMKKNALNFLITDTRKSEDKLRTYLLYEVTT